jgi:hypothetical protein
MCVPTVCESYHATITQGRYRIEERDLEKVELVSLGFSIFKEIDEVHSTLQYGTVCCCKAHALANIMVWLVLSIQH